MAQNTRNKSSNTQYGFTLIEMIVVVFVVGVGLIGALSFFNMNLSSQFEAKNELIAAGLAQEGADLVRNLVDYNKLQNGADWTTIADSIQGCRRIDFRSLSGAHPCNQGNNTYRICFSSGRYQQCPGGVDTGMTRTLSIRHRVDATNGDRLEINVNVRWNDDSRTTTAKDIIYSTNY